MTNIDFSFVQFYIKKKYSQKVEEYFDIGKQSISDWRTSNIVPSKRLIEFYQREGTLDLKELFGRIYKID